MKRSYLVGALLVSACSLFGSGNAAVQTSGVGSARASAIPVRLGVGGVNADLLDITLHATTDRNRSGTGGRSASAKATALRVQGPEPVVAGAVEAAADDGESSEQTLTDDPLSAPGIVAATLQSAFAVATVDDGGSRAGAGATLLEITLGDGLIAAETASASMSVDATATAVTATKSIDLPSVTALGIAEFARAAGATVESLSLEDLLEIAAELHLASTGTLGDLLVQEQSQREQLDAAEAALAAAQADEVSAQQRLGDAEDSLAAAQAQLVADQAAVATAEIAVAVATALGLSAALDAAEAELASAQAAKAATLQAIDAASADIVEATAELEALAETIYALGATITALGAEHQATVAALTAFEEDLLGLVSEASVVTFRGVHILLRASATASGGVPVIEISFDSVSAGGRLVGEDVSTVGAAVTLLPQIASALNGVGAVLGLPPVSVDVMRSAASSGTDADGYRYASVGFSLLEISLPTPDGKTLSLSVGDPEIFAEFAPSGAPAGGPGGDPNASAGDGGDGGAVPRLPSTGLPQRSVAGIGMLSAAGGLALRARRRRPI